MLFVFAAGGSGGHIMPALAVAQALKALEPEAEIVFVGAGRELEQQLIPPAGFELTVLPFLPLRGASIWGRIRMLANAPVSLLRAVTLLRRRKACAVAGFGGYMSFLPVAAGRILGLPCVLHEQNTVAGIANRVLARIADRVFSVPGSRGFPVPEAVRRIPLPLREEFYRVSPWHMPHGGRKFRILVAGGSQGASALNSGMIEMIPLLREIDAEVLHQAGVRDAERVRAEYSARGFSAVRVVDYIQDVAAELEETQLVVSRAGAMFAAELTASGRPVLYVPMNIAGAHQFANVEEQIRAKAALLVEQDERFVESLRAALGSLAADPAGMAAMAGAARRLSMTGEKTPAQVIAAELQALAREAGPANPKHG